jgi:flagellar motor switch protein FliN/FliY
MSDTVLSATLHAAAQALGERLPAAYGLEPGEVLVDGDATNHRMPADAVAVRWPPCSAAVPLRSTSWRR